MSETTTKYSYQIAGSSIAKTTCCEMKDKFTLESTYALEQLQQWAFHGEAYLMSRMKKIYASVVYAPSVEAISKIYRDAIEKNEAINPLIEVVSEESEKKYLIKVDNKIDGLIEGKYAAYDHVDHKILVSRILLCQAMFDNSKRGELMVALVEEFGHHIDYLLRKIDGEAERTKKGDIGAKYASETIKENQIDYLGKDFARENITIEVLAKKNQKFAKVNGTDLVWEYNDCHNELKRHVNETRQKRDDKSSERYSFYKDHSEEKHGFGHHEIEIKAFTKSLEELLNKNDSKKTDKEVRSIIDRIYFGNWMRDYSQLIDPQTVRPISNRVLNFAEAKFVATFLKGKDVKDGFTKIGAKALDIIFNLGEDNRDVYDKIADKTQSDEPLTQPPYDVTVKHRVKGNYVEGVLDIVTDGSTSVDDAKERVKEELLKGKIYSVLQKAIEEVVTNKELPKIKEWYNASLLRWQYKLQPMVWSQELLTNVVGVLATKEFMKDELKNLDRTNYKTFLESFEKDYVSVTPEVLGCYRPEEHIDNPTTHPLNTNEANMKLNKDPNDNTKGFVGVPTKKELEINREYGMKNYIRTNNSRVDITKFSTGTTAHNQLLDKLDEAQTNPNFDDPKKVDMKSMIAFGEALHIFEDFFAHTNYVEIALMKVGYDGIYPWVDEVPVSEGSILEPFNSHEYARLTSKKARDIYLQGVDVAIIKDANGKFLDKSNNVAQYIPLVTGSFGRLDMLASILPQVFKLLDTTYEYTSDTFKKGGRTLSDVMMHKFAKSIDNSIDDFLKSGISLDEIGLTDILRDVVPNLEDELDNYLEIRDEFECELNQSKLSDLDDRKIFYENLGKMRAKINFGLHLLTDFSINELIKVYNLFEHEITEMNNYKRDGDFGIGTNPTHTQVAKDDPHNILHKLAVELTIEADKRVGKLMFNAWKGIDGVSITDVINKVDSIMLHPYVTTWQDEIVKKWARQHRNQLCKIMTPKTAVESLISGIEHYDEFVELLEKQTTKIKGGIGENLNKSKNIEEAALRTILGMKEEIDNIASLYKDIDSNRITIGKDIAGKLNMEKERVEFVKSTISSLPNSKKVGMEKDEIIVIIGENPEEAGGIIAEYIKKFLKKAGSLMDNIDVENTMNDTEKISRGMNDKKPQISLYKKLGIVTDYGKKLSNSANGLRTKFDYNYYQPTECYETNEFEELLFELDRYTLTSRAKAELDLMVKGKVTGEKWNGGRAFSLEIIGYADIQGNATYNMKLSKRRANSVAKYFKEKTAWKSKKMKLLAKGEGELNFKNLDDLQKVMDDINLDDSDNKPIVYTEQDVNERNRRVKIVIIPE